MHEIDWEQAQQFRLALGLAKSPLVVYTNGKARHFRVSNGWLPRRAVEGFLQLAKDWSVGAVVDTPRPEPEDWLTSQDPDCFYSNGRTRRVWGARAGDIAGCTALRIEADGAGDPDELFQVLEERFCKPTLRVLTGNRGAHFYWRLWNQVSKEQHRNLQLRLHQLASTYLSDAGWDKNIYSHARVMRLPGSWHPKTGKQCSYWQFGGFYEVADLESRLLPLRKHTPPPSLVPVAVRRTGGRGWLGDLLERDPKRAEEVLVEMLLAIGPLGAKGSGTYSADNVCSLKAIVSELGGDTAAVLASRAGWNGPRSAVVIREAERGNVQAGLGFVVKKARDNGWRLSL